MNSTRRPRSVAGLLARLALLYYQKAGRRVAFLLLFLLLSLLCSVSLLGRASLKESDLLTPETWPKGLRVATFNIENFPKDQRQIEGAFRLINSLDMDVLGVQEIIEPETFAREARRRLGDSWRFVHVGMVSSVEDVLLRPAEEAGLDLTRGALGPREILLGVLYDASAYSLLSLTAHPETRVNERCRPTFEARLAPKGSGEVLRVLVVHLKSGSDGKDLRAQQLKALKEILTRATSSGDRVVLLGDFNSTEEADRADLAALARSSGMIWATEKLACSAFWQRREDCPTSRLDHVLTWRAPGEVRARGACETEGCDAKKSCPLYREQVSDHCPVVVSF